MDTVMDQFHLSYLMKPVIRLKFSWFEIVVFRELCERLQNGLQLMLRPVSLLANQRCYFLS